LELDDGEDKIHEGVALVALRGLETKHNSVFKQRDLDRLISQIIFLPCYNNFLSTPKLDTLCTAASWGRSL
jgi:hypothetical protein